MTLAQIPRSKRWMMATIVIFMIALLALVANYIIQQQRVKPTTTNHKATQPTTTVQPEVAAPVLTLTPAPAEEEDTVKLTAPLPDNATLAHEEIDRLNDQSQRLAEQKELLQQQIADSTQLIKMKEQYIADLQAQLEQAPDAS